MPALEAGGCGFESHAGHQNEAPPAIRPAAPWEIRVAPQKLQTFRTNVTRKNDLEYAAWLNGSEHPATDRKVAGSNPAAAATTSSTSQNRYRAIREPTARLRVVRPSATTTKWRNIMARGLILWLVGLPIPIIILLWLTGFLS